MRFKKTNITAVLILLGGGLLFGLITLGNLSFIRNSLSQDVGQELGPRWMATRLRMLEDHSPYSTAAEMNSRLLIRGSSGLKYFVYPPFSMVLFAPLALVKSYLLAKALWMTVLQTATLGLVFSSFAASKWNPPWKSLAAVFLFLLSWVYTLNPIYYGSVSPLTMFILNAAVLNLIWEQDDLAGFILAFSMFNPEIALPIAGFVLFWAYSRRRLRLIGSFVTGLVILLAGSYFVQPGWGIEALRQLADYLGEMQPGTPAMYLQAIYPGSGQSIGRVVEAVICLLLLIEWAAAWNKAERHFLWTASLTLAATPLTGLWNPVQHFVIYVPVFVFIYTVWERRGRGGGGRFVTAFLAWVWFYSWGLANWTVIDDSSQAGLFFLLPIVSILVLYWIRYWSVTALLLPVEEMKARRYI